MSETPLIAFPEVPPVDSDNSLTPITTDTEYKITDVDNTTVKIDINGTEITFKSLSGSRGLMQEFQATQVKYPGGKIISMTYTPISQNGAVAGYRVTGISDNLGNKLTINRLNMNGSDTSTLGKQLQGAISSVETNANNLNKQTATYTYEIQNVTLQGSSKPYAKLVKAVSTGNGTEDYLYTDYVHKGLFNNSSNSVYGVTLPLLSTLKKGGETILNWQTTSDQIKTYKNLDYDYASLIYKESVSGGTLTLNGPAEKAKSFTETFVINHSGENILYDSSSTFSCLKQNGLPLKKIVFAKKIRRLTSFTDKNGYLTNLAYDVNNRLITRTQAASTSIE
ncbi:hypothetical protein GCM10023206_12320 [Acinetobacter puyangensis]|uniref:YD repeat-containing protein n=1 Tax=Acinetobacter puyangensis TaxID=1096779 RepID=A0A240EC19_9GAMM|nr:hypothetical protein [Acinetobacter puyangensis]SNX45455.1 hypothetical protein SAMN05421731_1057 [Acinetobacter puyangensis]